MYFSNFVSLPGAALSAQNFTGHAKLATDAYEDLLATSRLQEYVFESEHIVLNVTTTEFLLSYEWFLEII